jgi:hypothetical protein
MSDLQKKSTEDGSAKEPPNPPPEKQAVQVDVSVTDQLAELFLLHRGGVLTAEEYTFAKQSVLRRL